MKVQAESFHLNGHIIGFRPQTQKLKSPDKTPSNTLEVKGLDETVLSGRTLGPVRVVKYLRSGADYLPPDLVVLYFLQRYATQAYTRRCCKWCRAIMLRV